MEDNLLGLLSGRHSAIWPPLIISFQEGKMVTSLRLHSELDAGGHNRLVKKDVSVQVHEAGS
jgi:hypothetical protein